MVFVGRVLLVGDTKPTTRDGSFNIIHAHPRVLRWPNTVFARAFVDAIQRAHKDCKNKHVVNRAIILFIQN